MTNLDNFRGTGVALITPLKNNAVDYDALTNIIEYQIINGVDFLVSLGTTGEAITLSFDECVAVLKHTIKVTNKRVPVVAGMFGSNNTAALIQKIKNFDFTGIDAILSSSPAYVKPTQDGIFAHYAAIEKVCPVPIILYNVPGRTASNINAQTIIRLARHSKKFIAVKDASGDMDQALFLIENKPGHFLVLSGDDPSCFNLITSGGDGVISVIGNAYPDAWSTMVRSIFNKDIELAKSVNLQLNPVHKWLYIEGNPTGIKAAMQHLDFCTRDVRLPLLPMTEPNLIHLKTAMDLAKTTLSVG